MKTLLASSIGLALLGAGLASAAPCDPQAIAQGNPAEPTTADIRRAFARQGVRLNTAEAASIRANVLLAVKEARAHGIGNSKVDFALVEIAQDLGLESGPGSNTLRTLRGAVRELMAAPAPPPTRPSEPPVAWTRYYDETVNLWNQPTFMSLLAEKKFHPVKISWEDIGRHEGSVWGDRISDVGIWVRRNEGDPQSAQLALSVRRDSNFRDKVLMVPADKIKVHLKQGDRTVERTLPERLRELGLASAARDRNVIVSNQFAVVPVPGRTMRGAWKPGTPPRAAFNFSIFPYGSTNFVITDVIEGSSDAIVGPGTHQLLYANIDGQKAPFTASRAEDRQDLLRLEKTLKAQGMDVDVQRYYLIQIPLKRNVQGLQLSNLGTPPLRRAFGQPVLSMQGAVGGAVASESMPAPPPAAKPAAMNEQTSKEKKAVAKDEAGFTKVAIGHGETEGPYTLGGGFRGQRAEEPIRVTVVYFVTPTGPVSRKDMDAFTKAFQAWDGEAIWGGSFVTKESM
jgi:hypothetical protein